MHLLFETDRWLDKFCVNSPDNTSDGKSSGKMEKATGEDKFVLVGKGGSTNPEEDSEHNSFYLLPRSSL